MTPRLFHVGEREVGRFEPRPSPPWSGRPGEPLVWAVDEDHLWLRLLPRACHRVHATGTTGATDAATDDRALLAGATRVVWASPGCVERCEHVRLHLHELPTEGFEVADAGAGYWVSDGVVVPTSVRVVAPLAELRDRQVDVRVTDDLEATIARVTASGLDWSVVRAPDAGPW